MILASEAPKLASESQLWYQVYSRNPSRPILAIKASPVINAVHALAIHTQAILDLQALVVKSTSPGRSPPSAAFSQVQLPASRVSVLLRNPPHSFAYQQLASRTCKHLPSPSDSRCWLGRRCTRQQAGLLRTGQSTAGRPLTGGGERTAGTSRASDSIFSRLLLACAVHGRLLAARTGRLLGADTIVALAAAGGRLDHFEGKRV